MSVVESKAKAELLSKRSEVSQKIKAQYKGAEFFLKDCTNDILLLIKHLMSGDIDSKIDGTEQRMTYEEVSEYLVSEGKLGYTPELIQLMTAYIGAFLLSTYKYDCENRSKTIKADLEKKYSRDANGVYGSEYKRIYDEYILANKDKLTFSSRLNKKLKNGIYSMDYILLGGTDAEVIDKIFSLSCNYKNVIIYGSELLSDDIKNFMKYFEKDGSIYTLWESSAFNMNYV